ncbi:hypothetical protein LNV08_15570 [Paucibacter sp. TC2R-5]|uniref:hypothetical protein n=1 Tax=Paucibacter sp. TC2R-5 TaxID=2893555 RepID=UPI0021E4689D|nr:hypothetical protein [Paucibacter sp. TC2R-5]MCV2360395.1 hypothetical protein [Paucibacter sp. TC2R-5]
MTIATVRIYYHPIGEARELRLTGSHWGFAEWFSRRLKPIREQLRGPEAKGVDIMNLMLFEDPEHAWQRDRWIQRGNSFQFSFVCNLAPLEASPAIENIPKLMQFYAAIAEQAPWPQARAVAPALRQALSPVDQVTLAPYLQWPRGEMISETKAMRIVKNAA